MTEQATKQLEETKAELRSRQLGLQEYQSQKQKEAKKFKLTVPFFVKILLALPLIIFFLFGLFFIPYMAFQSMSSASAGKNSSGNK